MILPLAILTGLAAQEIVLTDAGFRRREDCAREWLLRDWHEGHYWSAREAWVCEDKAYAAKWEGDGDGMANGHGERAEGRIVVRDLDAWGAGSGAARTYDVAELHSRGGGLYRREDREVFEWRGFNNFHAATHWMPLPDPPNQ